MPSTLVYGRVPHPGYVDLQATTADKPEGVGWDNLGRRTPKGVVLHRMVGTLRSTDQHFGNPAVGSLTDYGIGSANIDGAELDGVIHQYNDPRGWRSGWASGRVSAPYGDGAKFVAKYGINAVNRDLVSIETSGWDSEPFTAFAWGELVHLVAYWADQCQVPYSSLPLNPHTGINFVIWHQEFTIGTGKKCPFSWMMANTDRLYTDVAAFLKSYQQGVAGQPQPKPPVITIPAPKYADPLPIAELAAVADDDQDTIAAITTREADEFIYVGDRVRAVKTTRRLQWAGAKAPSVGPDIEPNQGPRSEFDVDYLVKAGDGEWYYITPWWSRIRKADTTRISDTKAAA